MSNKQPLLQGQREQSMRRSAKIDQESDNRRRDKSKTPNKKLTKSVTASVMMEPFDVEAAQVSNIKSQTNKQMKQAGLVKRHRQVGNLQNKFLSEPNTCIEIKSLKKEYQEYEQDQITFKPVDIYLKHCQEYADSNLQIAEIEVEGYKFRKNDFEQQVISAKFIEQLQNDQNTCDIKSLEDHEIATLFSTESIKIFSEILFYEGKQILGVKTWQKVCVSSKNAQEQNLSPRVLEQQNRLAVQKAQTRNQKSNLGKLSNSVTQIENSVEEESKFFYIKTIEFYRQENNKNEQICLPILAEIVFGKFDEYRLYDASLIQNDRYVYYFKRLFQDGQGLDSKVKSFANNNNDDSIGDLSNNTKGGGDDRSTLQLFVFDLKTMEEKIMPRSYSFNEQIIEQENETPLAMKGGAFDFQNISALSINYGRKLFNAQFSQRFTNETPPVTVFNRKDIKDEDIHAQFLRNQFVSIQEYVKSEERHQFYLYNMDVDDYRTDLSRCQIEFGSKYFQSQQENDGFDGKRQVQMIHHIGNYRGEKGFIYFVVQNQFSQLELKMDVRLLQITQLKIIIRPTSDIFQKIWNNNGIDIQRVDLKIYEQEIFKESKEQYYFIDSRNQIHLLFPSYTEKSKKREITERIMKVTGIQQNDFAEFKKIKYLSHNIVKKKPFYLQRIEHIQKILNFPEIGKAHQLTLCSDEFNQVLYISEPKSPKIATISMKDHNCQNCKVDDQMNLLMSRSMDPKVNELQSIITDTFKSRFSDIKKRSIGKETKNSVSSLNFLQMVDKDHPHNYIEYIMSPEEVRTQKIQTNDMSADGSLKISIPYEERQNHVYIDDFHKNKKKVKTYTIDENQQAESPSKRQVRLLFYQPCKDYATFIFAVFHLRNAEDDSEAAKLEQKRVKKSYIIVRKSMRDMDIIFRGSKPIIEEEDQVQIIKAWDHVCRTRFMDISKYQFENIAEIEFLSAKNTEQTKEYKYQYREIKLFFCKEVDQKVFINFVPFIYQERNSVLTNKLIVYDIYTQQIDESESINPSQSNKKYLHMDKFGFNNFSISRTTDINEEQDENAKSHGKLLKVKQQAKYQIFTLYTEKLGRYSCQEYIISHSVNGTENITIGQKQLLFSRQMIQNTDWQDLQESQPMPYYDQKDGCIKGCQLMLQMNTKERIELNLLDQDLNNTYTYRSQVMLLGQKRFNIKGKKFPREYVMVVSAILRKNIIEKKIFERSEAYSILRDAQTLILGVRIPDLKFVVLNGFQTISQDYFFQSQELLQGKTIADLCLSDPKIVKEGLEHSFQNQNIEGSIIEVLSAGDQVRKDTLKECQFYPKSLIISQDFNHVDTIERALENSFIKSAKYILDTVFQRLNSYSYNQYIMSDLPVIMRSAQLDINEFYSISDAEKKDRSSEGFCNIEIPFKNAELPVFSNVEREYFTKMKFDDFHDIEKELVNQINFRDKEKLNKEKSIEVEHLYVDFKYLIIGEKIRSLTQESEDQKIPRFDDLYYAIFFLKSGDNNNNFYLQESVQKIIEFQFVETKKIMKFIFHLFTWMYGIPISILLFTKKESIHQKMLNIALVPTVLLFLVEVIEMRYRGKDYIRGKKVIDIGQAVLFWTLQILNRVGIADTAPFMPFINLALVLASFLKLLYYMRIFEQYGFLIQMILFCLADLGPFIISFVVFNFIFIICFTVIGMEIDPEVDEGPVNSYFLKTALQAFRTTYGELGVPVYWHLLTLKDPDCPFIEANMPAGSAEEPNPGACEWVPPTDIYKRLKIAMIWILWFAQTFWMLVVMLNFLIGVINGSYEKAMTFQEIIRYRHKAELNEECCIYKSFFYKLKEYKTIIFSTSKAMDQTQKDFSVEIMASVQKYIGSTHKDQKAEENRSVDDLAKCIDLQEDLKNTFKEKFEKLVEKHGTIEQKVYRMLGKRR